LAAPVEEIQSLLVPCQEELLQSWPVSRRVSNAGQDDAGLNERESVRL
jgi:putative SOS response-associated peptidase YedK